MTPRAMPSTAKALVGSPMAVRSRKRVQTKHGLDKNGLDKTVKAALNGFKGR